MLFLQHRCKKFHSQFQSIQNSTRIKNSALTLQFRGNCANLQIFIFILDFHECHNIVSKQQLDILKSEKRKIDRFHGFIVWLGGPKVLGKLFGSPANDKIVNNQ